MTRHFTDAYSADVYKERIVRLRLQYFTFYNAWYELTFHFYLDFLGVRRPEIEIVHDDNWSEYNVLHQAGVEWSGSAGTGGTIQRQLASKLVASWWHPNTCFQRFSRIYTIRSQAHASLRIPECEVADYIR